MASDCPPPTRGCVQSPVTILVLDLGGPSEDPVGHLHSPGGPKVGAVHFALLAEAGQDLAGLHGVPPDIVAVSVGGDTRASWGLRVWLGPSPGGNELQPVLLRRLLPLVSKWVPPETPGLLEADVSDPRLHGVPRMGFQPPPVQPNPFPNCALSSDTSKTPTRTLITRELRDVTRVTQPVSGRGWPVLSGLCRAMPPLLPARGSLLALPPLSWNPLAFPLS